MQWEKPKEVKKQKDGEIKYEINTNFPLARARRL